MKQEPQQFCLFGRVFNEDREFDNGIQALMTHAFNDGLNETGIFNYKI